MPGMIALHWIYFLILLAVMCGAMFINILTLPGLWLMAAAAILYALVTGFAFLGWRTIVVLLLLAFLAEGAEIFVGQAPTRKAGGGRLAGVGAIVGGILGGMFLSLIPIPIVSTIVGVCAGSFLGAMLMHIVAARDIPVSIRVGAGAAAGRFLGILVKLAFGAVMFVIIAWEALPIGGKPQPALTPAMSTPPRMMAPTSASTL
jgi:uncharacterized protein YqgC (DUF456 family)